MSSQQTAADSTLDPNVYAELITIGDEILFGQIVNTNAQWMGVELSNVGIRVRRHTSVGDKESEIIAALTEAAQRAHIVLITGGLGPTKDDITKHTLAAWFESPMAENPEALAHLEALLARRGRTLNDLNRQQANQPTKATYIHNAIGTAPGMWFDLPKGDQAAHDMVFVSMPGVPAEMKKMMRDIIIPKLVARFDPPIIIHKVIRTIGMAESNLAELIESWENALPANMSLAYLPSFGQVKLRLTGTGSNATELLAVLNEQVNLVLPLIKDYVYGFDQDELEKVIGRLLQERNATLATAESFTGGSISQLITAIPGSSGYFLGGVVAYDNEVKINTLGVERQLIINHGAVSPEVAEAMAVGVQRVTGATFAISTTGIAGPGGGSEAKPVGLVYSAVAYPGGVFSVKQQLLVDRHLNIQMGSLWALNLLRKHLSCIID